MFLLFFRLREMCALYIDHADVANIYNKYVNETLKLADLLCRYLHNFFLQNVFL